MLKIFVVFLLILFNWKRMPIYSTLPCRYLSTFSKIKMRFHPLAYICSIKILLLIFEVQVVNIWPCHNNLENNYVFSWGQTRAFMFFLLPYFLLFFLNSKPLVIFLCWQKKPPCMYERTFVECWKFCNYNTTNHVFSPYR